MLGLFSCHNETAYCDIVPDFLPCKQQKHGSPTEVSTISVKYFCAKLMSFPFVKQTAFTHAHTEREKVQNDFKNMQITHLMLLAFKGPCKKAAPVVLR